MSFIQTFSGGTIYPLAPTKEALNIIDIAHALSTLCRFTGHVRQFYSVAEHCVRASFIVPLEYAAEALLHDASEAYLCDIARPVKVLPAMADYREAERKLERVISERYGTPFPMSAAVKDADNVMLLTEKRDLMAPCAEVWQPIAASAHHARLEPFSQEYAELLFLARFKELFPNEKHTVYVAPSLKNCLAALKKRLEPLPVMARIEGGFNIPCDPL